MTKQIGRNLVFLLLFSLSLYGCGSDNTVGSSTISTSSSASTVSSTTLATLLTALPCSGSTSRIMMRYQGAIQKDSNGRVWIQNVTPTLNSAAQYYSSSNSYIGKTYMNDIMVYTETGTSTAEIAFYMCADSFMSSIRTISVGYLVKQASLSCTVNEVSSATVVFYSSVSSQGLPQAFYAIDMTASGEVSIAGICN